VHSAISFDSTVASLLRPVWIVLPQKKASALREFHKFRTFNVKTPSSITRATKNRLNVFPDVSYTAAVSYCYGNVCACELAFIPQSPRPTVCGEKRSPPILGQRASERERGGEGKREKEGGAKPGCFPLEVSRGPRAPHTPLSPPPQETI